MKHFLQRAFLCSLFIALGILFTVARATGATVIEPVPVTGKIQWVYSYAEGQKLARESGKPLLVIFRCER